MDEMAVAGADVQQAAHPHVALHAAATHALDELDDLLCDGAIRPPGRKVVVLVVEGGQSAVAEARVDEHEPAFVAFSQLKGTIDVSARQGDAVEQRAPATATEWAVLDRARLQTRNGCLEPRVNRQESIPPCLLMKSVTRHGRPEDSLRSARDGHDSRTGAFQSTCRLGWAGVTPRGFNGARTVRPRSGW